jgi:hypothetical protein
MTSDFWNACLEGVGAILALNNCLFLCRQRRVQGTSICRLFASYEKGIRIQMYDKGETSCFANS